MYPDDQPHQPTHNTMGPPPAPFTLDQSGNEKSHYKKTPRNNLGLFIGLVGGVLFILVLIIIVLAGTGKNTKPAATVSPSVADSQQTRTQDATTCDAQKRRYQNPNLDVRFCYPNSWGEVKVADAKFDPSDGGTRVGLSFADKPQVHIGLVSDDWSSDTAREVTCAGAAVQAFPDTSTFSAKWIIEGSGDTVSAVRGLEVVPDKYLLQERVDNLLSNGVCVEGYQVFDGDVYRIATATYSAQFTAAISTPQIHMNNPVVLVPVADRIDFATFVKSIQKY